jgi:hypothetical protein
MTEPVSGPAESLAAEMRADYKMRGVLVQMVERGQILSLACEMPTCYSLRGRKRFDPIGSVPDDWVPTHDHHPTLKSRGGKRVASNSRLAHKKCNRVDEAWKNKIGPMLDQGLCLKEISDVLNADVVEPPRGQKGWTPRSVRYAYVS